MSRSNEERPNESGDAGCRRTTLLQIINKAQMSRKRPAYNDGAMFRQAKSTSRYIICRETTVNFRTG